MKEVKQYICDYCGTTYKDKVKCEKCEKGHISAKSIAESFFQPFGSDKTGYPHAIMVNMSDGNTIKYVRASKNI